jgi:hypothetical protein
MRAHKRRRWPRLLCALAAAFAFWLLQTLSFGRGGDGGRPITLGYETARITAPLRDDATVDYAAALEERYSRGVTPENNAAVFFWRAIGPAAIGESRRAELFRRLGMEPLPEEGDYLELHLGVGNVSSGLADALVLHRIGRVTRRGRARTSSSRAW